jgi:hypothetical protein
MATRNGKAKLATVETTYPSFSALSSLQTENSRPKSSMSENGKFTTSTLPAAIERLDESKDLAGIVLKSNSIKSNSRAPGALS